MLIEVHKSRNRDAFIGGPITKELMDLGLRTSCIRVRVMPLTRAASRRVCCRRLSWSSGE